MFRRYKDAFPNIRLWAFVILSLLILLWMLLWSGSGSALVAGRGCKCLSTIREKDPSQSHGINMMEEFENDAVAIGTRSKKQEGRLEGSEGREDRRGGATMEKQERSMQLEDETRESSPAAPKSAPLVELPTFIINLKDREEKRNLILSRTSSMTPKPEVIEAVDGRLLDRSNGSWTRGERACLKSHMKALSRFIESGYPYGLILEDDANISLPEDLEAIKRIVSETPSDWGAISLGINYDYMPPDSVKVSDRVYRLNKGIILGTHAILYTQEAAKNLLDEQEWIQRWIKPEADYMLPYDLWLARPGSPAVLYFVVPALVSQKIEGSDTQGFQKRRMSS